MVSDKIGHKNGIDENCDLEIGGEWHHIKRGVDDDEGADDDDGECIRSGQRIERRSIPVRLNPPGSSTLHHHHSTNAPIKE